MFYRSGAKDLWCSMVSLGGAILLRLLTSLHFKTIIGLGFFFKGSGFSPFLEIWVLCKSTFFFKKKRKEKLTFWQEVFIFVDDFSCYQTSSRCVCSFHGVRIFTRMNFDAGQLLSLCFLLSHLAVIFAFGSVFSVD